MPISNNAPPVSLARLESANTGRMAKIPWFKCYAGDLLGALAEMTPFEAALYVTCLLRMYDEDGPIPDQIERLARRCNMRLSDCRRAMDGLERQGRLVRSNGHITNSRAQKELTERTRYSEVQSANRTKKPTKSNQTTNNGSTGDVPYARALEARSQSIENQHSPPVVLPPISEVSQRRVPAGRLSMAWVPNNDSYQFALEEGYDDEAYQRVLASFKERRVGNPKAISEDWDSEFRATLRDNSWRNRGGKGSRSAAADRAARRFAAHDDLEEQESGGVELRDRRDRLLG